MFGREQCRSNIINRRKLKDSTNDYILLHPTNHNILEPSLKIAVSQKSNRKDIKKQAAQKEVAKWGL